MKMTDSEKNLEEIFEEYLLLLQDGQYHEVIYDEESGGVSAIHQEHRFDKQPGPFGARRGVYELMAIDALRKKGHVVILESERAPDGVKIEILVFYYHLHDLFSIEKIEDGWKRFIQDIDSQRYEKTIKKVLCVVEGEVVEWIPPKKNKAAGAALLEGLSQQVLKSTSQPFTCIYSKSFRISKKNNPKTSNLK